MDIKRRIPFVTTVLATLLAAAAPMPMPAAAATDAVLRCRSPDGSILYTDRSCAAFGAESVPMPGELLTRIAREEARAADYQGLDADSIDAGGLDTIGHAAYHAVAVAPGRRSPASGCARDPVQLAMDVDAALALGDVNRLAESYHFAGMSSAAGERTLDRLQELMGHVVLSSQYFDASIQSAGTLLAGPGSAGPGMLQLVLDNGEGRARAVDFDVRKYAGCYFVSF